MKKYSLGIILIMLLVLTTGCKKSIIGKWKVLESKTEYYYIFNKDKTCSYEMAVARLDCTYEEDGENLSILYNGNSEPTAYKYHFDGSTLIITDSANRDTKFTKGK